jgi:hypothetical protein
MVAALADVEGHSTVTTKTLVQYDWFGGHLSLSKALDDGRPYVRG